MCWFTTEELYKKDHEWLEENATKLEGTPKEHVFLTDDPNNPDFVVCHPREYHALGFAYCPAALEYYGGLPAADFYRVSANKLREIPRSIPPSLLEDAVRAAGGLHEVLAAQA